MTGLICAGQADLGHNLVRKSPKLQTTAQRGFCTTPLEVSNARRNGIYFSESRTSRRSQRLLGVSKRHEARADGGGPRLRIRMGHRTPLHGLHDDAGCGRLFVLHWRRLSQSQTRHDGGRAAVERPDAGRGEDVDAGRDVGRPRDLWYRSWASARRIRRLSRQYERLARTLRRKRGDDLARLRAGLLRIPRQTHRATESAHSARTLQVL